MMNVAFICRRLCFYLNLLKIHSNVEKKIERIYFFEIIYSTFISDGMIIKFYKLSEKTNRKSISININFVYEGVRYGGA